MAHYLPTPSSPDAHPLQSRDKHEDEDGLTESQLQKAAADPNLGAAVCGSPELQGSTDERGEAEDASNVLSLLKEGRPLVERQDQGEPLPSSDEEGTNWFNPGLGESGSSESYFAEDDASVGKLPDEDQPVRAVQATKIQFDLHKKGINVNGRLAIEVPSLAKKTADMDLQPTPLATQPYFDPRRGDASELQQSTDLADIIAILHPTTEVAIDAVRFTTKASPQHVRHNATLERFLDDDIDLRPIPVAGDPQVEATQSTQPQDAAYQVSSDNELALRFSSRVRDLNMGFTFGRSVKDCDIVFQQHNIRTNVSQIHFRIFITDDDVVMIEDCSTNGTFLDAMILRSKNKHVLSHGSKIEIVTYAETRNGAQHQERAGFVVLFPQREDENTVRRYHRNFRRYKDARQKAHQEAQGNEVPANNGNGAPADNGYGRHEHAGVGQSRPNTFGMHWNGAPQYNVVGNLGRGAFATVYKLATRYEAKIYAAKEIQKKSMYHLDQKIENEVAIMKKVKHPYVVELFESVDKSNHLYLIMEFMPYGDVLAWTKNRGLFEEAQAANMARQLCHALSYIHSLGITHRDIKPENVLLFDLDPLWVKLSDFGLSKVIEGSVNDMGTFCGTMLYLAPEVYPEYEKLATLHQRAHPHKPSTAKYDTSIDVWSLGTVLFSVIIGKPPYQVRQATQGNQATDMLRTILYTRLNWDRARDRLSETGIDFLRGCLQVNPALRPSALELLDDTWLRDLPAPTKNLPEPVTKQEKVQLLGVNQLLINGVPAQVTTQGLYEPSSGIDIPDAFLDYRQHHPASDDEPADLPVQAKNHGGGKLFGEVDPTGRGDSGIFGGTETPIIRKGRTARAGTTPDPGEATEPGSPLQSTVSQVQDLNIGTPAHHSTHPASMAPPAAPSAPSFLKRAREGEPADVERNTSQRFMSDPLPGKTQDFGRLVPVEGSIPEAMELVMHAPMLCWGRHTGLSHPWPHASDKRVPRTGMDIIIFSPEVPKILAKHQHLDWVNADLATLEAAGLPIDKLDSLELEVYLKTRASNGISVNGVTLNKVPARQLWHLIRLRSGDVIEAFDFGESDPKQGKLQYRCEFFVGLGKEPRKQGREPFVTTCADLQSWCEDLNAKVAEKDRILE